MYLRPTIGGLSRHRPAQSPYVPSTTTSTVTVSSRTTMARTPRSRPTTTTKSRGDNAYNASI